MAAHVEEAVGKEVVILQAKIKELGTLNEATGKWEVPFGKLYDETVDIFEALAGTLKAAKKRKVVDYGAPLLLKGAHDKVPIVLLVEADA